MAGEEGVGGDGRRRAGRPDLVLADDVCAPAVRASRELHHTPVAFHDLAGGGGVSQFPHNGTYIGHLLRSSGGGEVVLVSLNITGHNISATFFDFGGHLNI